MASEDAFWRRLVDAASQAYQGSDGHAVRFARAKLGDDRVFRHVLEHGLIAPGARVLDVGCGQGLFASLLHAANQAARRSDWPPTWAAAPLGAHVTGIDPLALDIERAIKALGGAASFICADMRRFAMPACDAVVFFDTLHYIAPHEQDAALENARNGLRPGGVLLLRVHDASAPLRFAFGLWVDRLTMLLHGGGYGRLAGRSLAGWRTRLEQLGFEVSSIQMNGRRPFANLLIVARLPKHP